MNLQKEAYIISRNVLWITLCTYDRDLQQLSLFRAQYRWMADCLVVMDMVIFIMFNITLDTVLVEHHPYIQSIFQTIISVTTISTMRIEINHSQDTLDQYLGAFEKHSNRKIWLSLVGKDFKQKHFYMSLHRHRQRD